MMNWLFAALLASTAEEEAAMVRMLTLAQKSLISDRPLPVKPLGTTTTATPAENNTCSASVDGHPTGVSPWAAKFAALEHADFFPPVAASISLTNPFTQTTKAIHDGRFATARQKLHSLCLRGQGIAEKTPSASEANVLERWVGDCATLLKYVPEAAPNREDHKRLLMLLHDLGGSLMLLHYLGVLSPPLLPVEPLADLADALGNSFGEWNRKTALTRALGAAVRSADASSASAELLRENGLCSPPPYGEAAKQQTKEEEHDMWSEVGVRACATLLLRGRRVGEALDVLRALTVPAPTLHPFLSAFEFASRLPMAPTDASSPPPSRFSPEQMLEVLEAALESPQHGLASEGNLLRWQLKSALRWGQATAPEPPLDCPPPSPSPLLETPRVLIVMPFVDSEQKRLKANLGSWADGGGVEPCLDKPTTTTGGVVDVALYSADKPGVSSWLPSGSPEKLLGGGSARCFNRVFVRHANLSKAEQHYIGGWDNTGPNNLFYRLFHDDWLHANYDVLLWMETDMVPIKPDWISRVLEEARYPRGFWRKGPAQQPKLQHAMVSTHHYHMNSAGLYRLGQPCFIELMRRVETEHPKQPHDVSTHLFLHDPRHFHIWQAHAHRFLYTDLVQNRLDAWSAEGVKKVSEETMFVHGKHRSS